MLSVASASLLASCTLELPAFGADPEFGVVVWDFSGLDTIPVHFLELLRARKEHSVSVLWRLHGQLVEGEALLPRIKDATLGWPLTHSVHTFSWGTSRIHTSSVAILITTALLFSCPGSFIFWIIWIRDRDCWLVQLIKKKPFQRKLIEGRIGPSGQKLLQLD